MKIKPKEIFVTLPVVLPFDDAEKIPEFAANINTIMHGKVKLKYEELGRLGPQTMAIFYLQRNGEYHELRNEFTQLIEQEEADIAWLNAPLNEEEKRLVEQGDLEEGIPWD